MNELGRTWEDALLEQYENINSNIEKYNKQKIKVFPTNNNDLNLKEYKVLEEFEEEEKVLSPEVNERRKWDLKERKNSNF